MYEGEDNYRIAEAWDDLRKGRIPCEKDLKEDVEGLILSYGTEKVGKGHKWIRRNPVSIINEIITDILTDIVRGIDHTETPLTEEDLDKKKLLRIRFILIRRAVKNILKEENID